MIRISCYLQVLFRLLLIQLQHHLVQTQFYRAHNQLLQGQCQHHLDQGHLTQRRHHLDQNRPQSQVLLLCRGQLLLVLCLQGLQLHQCLRRQDRNHSPHLLHLSRCLSQVPVLCRGQLQLLHLVLLLQGRTDLERLSHVSQQYPKMYIHHAILLVCASMSHHICVLWLSQGRNLWHKTML